MPSSSSSYPRHPSHPVLWLDKSFSLTRTEEHSKVQPAGAPPFTKSTKYNDLPEDTNRAFENIETCSDLQHLEAQKLGDEALKGQEEIRNVQKELAGAIAVLRDDVQHTRDLKHKVDQAVQDTIIATRIMRGRLRWYKATLEQIERKLSSAAPQPQYTPQCPSFPAPTAYL
ncbi:hypothetical protein C8T65DRAFT_738603 [Cerioporus squamosus]|nr:hypothetical protein C8T65DRAFT_738571 [Cerioporus squamosus]KAI0715514.1 hypothetical protein C8T65DRAFT_738603 [Cerioporus squamosus]